MNDQLPAVTLREVIAALNRAGFVRRKSRGHIVLRGNGRTVALPRGELRYRTLKLILKQSGLTAKEFKELLG